jgi:16S rRNA (cytidine1402-2'-O)-methyltransferase
MNAQKKGKLFLIPTPLSDGMLDKTSTTQLLEVVKSVKLFVVENVRTARRFISSLDLDIDIQSLKFEVLDKRSSWEHVQGICSPMNSGEHLGLMSEAGCPGIADPGNLAIRFAHEHDVQVIPLVGPSAMFMALMASGFNGQSFVFHGYLPIDKQQRYRKIREIEDAVFQKDQTQIFMETPYRNDQLLKDILKYCKPATQLCIARDITGKQELIRTRSIRDWRKEDIELHKIPTVFLLYK